MTKNGVYILEAKRSPIGKFGGGLRDVDATEIGAQVINATVERYEGKLEINEVVVGNVLGAGLGQNPARTSAMRAGLSDQIPAYTVNKVCGSGLKSVALGYQSILMGDSEVVIAGGIENMSRAPYLLENNRWGVKFGHQKLKDSILSDGIWCSLIDKHMGITAENIAQKYQISRETQDEFSLESHLKAIKAIKNGQFENEIVPIRDPGENSVAIKADEQPRGDTSVSVLSKLKPVFQEGGCVTAGNASSLNDGAAMVLLGSEKAINGLEGKPLARIVATASIGTDPSLMGMGSYYAAQKCLILADKKVEDVGLWEINEAFASQSIAVINELIIDPEIVNVNGGAIALGHPIGASGARILVTLLHEMNRRDVRLGMASLCIGGGQGIAILVEAT